MDLLGEAAVDVVYSHFVVPSFLVCCGLYTPAMQVMNSFFNTVSNLEEAVGIAEMVVYQITTMGIHLTGRYGHHFRFGDSLPHCFVNNFSVLHLCRKCFW